MKQKDSEKKRIESLDKSDGIYQILFENADDAIIIAEGSKIIDCNKAAFLMFGCSSKEDLSNRFPFPGLPFDEIQSTGKALQLISSANPEIIQKFNCEYLKSDGTSLDAEVTLNSFSFENHILQQFTIREVMLQNKYEQELIKAEIKYKNIFTNIQDVLYRIDLMGNIVEISPSVEKYTNYTLTEIIGKPIENFYFNPDERKQLIRQMEEKGEVLDYELLLKSKENEPVWASVNSHFIFDENGQITGIEGSIRDLSGRKQTEGKLKLSLSLLQATLDSTADGILVVDRSGKITSYNKQFKAMFDLSEKILDLGDDASTLQSVLNQMKDTEQFINKVQFLYNNPELESFDTIELNDGRVIERFSCAQRLDGKPIGRVWSFRDVTVREKIEQQLQLMAHTLNSINECISMTDIENCILFINEAFLKTYGYTKEELVRQNISIVRSPNNDEEEIGQILHLTKSTGWHGETINRRKDGSDFPISLSTSVVKNEKGEILGLVGVAVDISERKQVENELRESEKRFRLLIENQGEGTSIVDPNENFLFANPAAEVIFGVKQGELVNRNLREFIVTEHFEQILQESGKRAKNVKSTYEVDIVTPHGIRKNLLITATPQINDDGKFTGTFGVFRDITDRKQAEELLRQSEMKYRNLIETMPDGVYRSTPEGKFVEVNPAMVKILGYKSKEELMAIDIKTQLYIDPIDRENFILKHNAEKLDVYPMKKKDGSALWVEDHGWYITDKNGQTIFLEGIIRDVTERKMAEIQLQKYSEELQELNATKDKFFSIIAHDLKSPFNSITGLSEIIKDEAKHLDIETIEQYAGIIYSTSQNTYRLLENLLDWALVQQSRMPFRPCSVILKNIVGEVIELLNEMANRKMIAVINCIPENLIVVADEDMLKTILRNLISNALKFTSANGKVEIKAVIQPNEIEIAVKDSGTGIEKADILKIFKIGSNYSKRGTENEKGTGLGLALCKEFVEKHGGRIWVESEEGKGSLFTFTINRGELLNK